MADKYKNFEELAANEREGSDFQVRFRARRGTAAVIALHSGGIEPGTSELAEAIANVPTTIRTCRVTRRRRPQ